MIEEMNLGVKAPVESKAFMYSALVEGAGGGGICH